MYDDLSAQLLVISTVLSDGGNSISGAEIMTEISIFSLLRWSQNTSAIEHLHSLSINVAERAVAGQITDVDLFAVVVSLHTLALNVFAFHDDEDALIEDILRIALIF